MIDRDYFWAIYFRTPGGVLFEVATNEPGFDRDEDTAHLGEALKLPKQHAHLREQLEKRPRSRSRIEGSRAMSIDAYKYRREDGGGPGAPLVFAFHGTGGDENQFFALAEQIWPGARVIAPRGDVSEHGAAALLSPQGRGRLRLRRPGDADAERWRSSCAPTSSARSRAGRSALGYSNGANILASVAFADAELFDEIILMHPLVPWSAGRQSRARAAARADHGGSARPDMPAVVDGGAGRVFRAARLDGDAGMA